MKKSLSALAGFAVLASIGIASPAFAHAKLLSSNPANNAVVSTAPRALTLRFNERVVPTFTKVVLTMPEHRGMTVPVKVSFDKVGKTVTVVPNTKLGKGSYNIEWSAASSDGHKLSGHVHFKVG